MNATKIMKTVVLSVSLILLAGSLSPGCSSPKSASEPPAAAKEPATAVEAPQTAAPAPEAPAEALAEKEEQEKAAATQEEEIQDDVVADTQDYTPQLRPYAESPYAANIDAGLVYMAEHKGELSCNWMDYFVLDYLQRKFGLDEWFSAKELLDAEALSKEDSVNYHLHARLVVPGHRIESKEVPFEDSFLFADYAPGEEEAFITTASLKHVGVPLSRFMLRAMYCDVEPVDSAYAAELVRLVMETDVEGDPNNFEGYLATHLILSYQWLKELGCAEALDELANMEENLAEVLYKIIRVQNGITDLALEAGALLHYMGRLDVVPEELVEGSYGSIAQAQMDNGAWDRNGGTRPTPSPQCHTTVFALWNLLENALPDAPDISWLR
ncbi:MAG TPA: hypothetical protein ENN29_04535 [Candidatus Hydrogenedentes bacterium]|nr:hypothetical protein [Candidatus Hydrogenedentota bacterium]